MDRWSSGHLARPSTWRTPVRSRHGLRMTCGSSSPGRAPAFQAGVRGSSPRCRSRCREGRSPPMFPAFILCPSARRGSPTGRRRPAQTRHSAGSTPARGTHAAVAHQVERGPGTTEVASSSLAGGSHADVAQLVARHLAKVKVAGSNPVVRSTLQPAGGTITPAGPFPGRLTGRPPRSERGKRGSNPRWGAKPV
jgi:hypothetical protein